MNIVAPGNVRDGLIVDLRNAQEELEIMFRHLEAMHDRTGYVGNRDFVGIDENLDNVKAAIKNMKNAVLALGVAQ